MEFIKTEIEDLIIIKPSVYKDGRGYFMEAFKESIFKDKFPHIDFIQDNESASKYGILRGLHFQINPFSQTKLVRVSYGEVLDVAVDLRKKSKTFGKYFSINLNSNNKLQLLIPRGFAHGYVVLSNYAIFNYKVDSIYSPKHEKGIIWNDPNINIDWKIPIDEIKLSKKDKNFKNFNF